MSLFPHVSFYKRFLIGSFFAVVFFGNILVTTPVAQAGVWGESIAGVMLDNIINIIKTQLKGAILGTLKVAAIEIINSRVGQMVGGSTAGNALFVTDWNQFLYEKPAAEVDLYMNDFFSKLTVGKNSTTNYVGIGDATKNVNGGYATYLAETAKASTGSEVNEVYPTFNFDEYAASADEMFAKGNFLAMDAFFTNPVNNPIGFSLIAEQKQRTEYQKKLDKIKTEMNSSGYIAPKDAKGNTIAPLATLEGMQKDAMNIGNNLIAAATEPGEFLAGVVGAMVNKTITNIVQRGVGKIQASIKKEIRTFDKKVSKELQRADKKLGPAAKYLKDVSQRTDAKVKPYTKPPPAANCTVDQGC